MTIQTGTLNLHVLHVILYGGSQRYCALYELNVQVFKNIALNIAIVVHNKSPSGAP